METVLQIDKLTKSYPNFCLDGISFSVPKGMIVGLIGENGAGKTTTINLILHAIEKDNGNISIFGKDHILCEKEIKQSIGIVQDECNLPLMFTASDIERVMKRIYRDWDSGRYYELIDKFDLPQKQAITTFSKGMKVKLNFAIALAHKSRLLLLDESTSNLDPVMRDDVLDLLLDFVQDEENGVLFSTHITSDLSKIADYIAFLHEGKLLFCRPKDDLIYHYGLVHCGEKLFQQIDRCDILAWRKQDYEYQILVADREACAAGIWFAILMVCFGIPGGYFFKDDLCTGAMIGSCVIVGIIRSLNADILFFSIITPLSIVAALLMTLLLVYASYKISLWIFTVKRHQIGKLRISQS